MFYLLYISRTSGPSVAGLETTYSGGNGFSTSYNSQRWLNLYLSACKLLDLALALPPESLPQFQMSVQTHQGYNVHVVGLFMDRICEKRKLCVCACQYLQCMDTAGTIFNFKNCPISVCVV